MSDPSLEERLSAYLGADSETSRVEALKGASRQEADRVRSLAAAMGDADPPTLPQDGREWIGRIVGRYRVQHEIARGGMAYVFEAIEVGSEKRVALKVPRNDLAPELQAESYRLIALEHQIASTVASRYLIRVDHIGQDGDVPYLVMERIGSSPRRRGARSLREVIDADHFRDTDARRWTTQLLFAVKDLHEAGFAHRDIKPENILIDEKDQIRLIDFGIAKDLNASPNANATMKDFGTRGYVPRPSGDATTTAIRRDIHACGEVMSELIRCDPKEREGPVTSYQLRRRTRCEELIADIQNSEDGSFSSVDEVLREYRRITRPATSHPLALTGYAAAAVVLSGFAFTSLSSGSSSQPPSRFVEQPLKGESPASGEQGQRVSVAKPATYEETFPPGYLLAFNAIYRKDWELCDSLFDDLAAAEPEWAAVGRGWMWLHRREPNRALDAITAMETHTIDGTLGFQARTLQAKALRDAGQSEESLAAFQSVLELEPIYADQYRDRAEAFIALGNMTKAHDAIREADRFEPGYVDALAAKYPLFAAYLASQSR